MRKPKDILWLTPFEEYMFVDDTPAFPMYSYQALRFSLPFDFAALDASYREAFARHPLLNAAVEKRGKKFFWRLRDEFPEIYQRTRSIHSEPTALPVDITKEGGTRVILDTLLDDEGKFVCCELAFQVHHTSSDATGIFLFIHDLLVLYSNRTAGTAYPLSPLSDESMAIRWDYGMTVKKYLRYLPKSTRTTLSLLFHFCSSLLPVPKVDKKVPLERYPRITTIDLDREETAIYTKEAKRLGVTLNDLLLSDLFVATAQFMKEAGINPKKRIRIAMPMNLRTETHRGLFATNMVSMVFLDRKIREVDSSTEFIRGLHQNTDWIKKNEQGLTLIKNLEGCRNLPGGIPWQMSLPRCWSTTVLSNLGRVFGNVPFPKDEQGHVLIGDSRIIDYYGFPPLRYKTLLTWGVWTYAGKMRLAARWDDRYLTQEETDKITRLFKEQIVRSHIPSALPE